MLQVFVYGSLLEGLPNHGLLLNGTFLGAASTPPVYTMLSLGAFPGLIGGGSSIKGEVYKIDGRILDALDTLEGYPSFYTREEIQTKYGGAWIYKLSDTKRYQNNKNIVAEGDWRAFLRHNKRFVYNVV